MEKKLNEEGFRTEWRKDDKETDEQLFNRLMKRRERVVAEVKEEIRRLQSHGVKPRRSGDWDPIEEKKLLELESKYSVTLPGVSFPSFQLVLLHVVDLWDWSFLRRCQSYAIERRSCVRIPYSPHRQM